MELTREQTQKIIDNGKAQGLDTKKILDGLISRGYNIEGIDTEAAKAAIARENPAPEQTRGEETVADIKQVGTDVVTAAKERSSNVGESIEAMNRGEQGIGRTFLQTIGQGAGLVSDTIGAGIKGAVKTILPQDAEDATKGVITEIATPIMQSKTAQDIMSMYKTLDPKIQRDISAALGAGSLITDVVGGGLVGKGVKASESVVKSGVKNVAEGVANTAIKGADIVAPGIKKVTGGISDVVSPLVKEAKLIPGRVSTNIAAKKVAESTIESLPSTAAKTAARSGIDVADIQSLYNMPKGFKDTAKKLLKATQDFASGASKTNPLEIVGQPIVKSIKQAETFASDIGKKIGEVANKLPSVTTQELAPSVLANIKKVRGLEDLIIDEKGLLNFDNTVLATAGTAGDRSAIQAIFDDAIKAGTGKQKHLLRQELFEILGGKKKAGIQITGTQEKAYEAIRKGIADVLDAKNATYKNLNLKYAQALDPLKKLRKMLNVKGASGQVEEDILDMSAGLLARRLTSFAKSNPEIRSVLNALDKAVKSKGKTLVNTENLQDFYNILDKYYDIAGKTSLQGQVGAGIENASSVKDLIVGKLRDVAGESKAVKEKVLKDLFNDIL